MLMPPFGCQCCGSVTHRLIRKPNPDNNPPNPNFEIVWSEDFGAEIQPSGNLEVTGIAQEDPRRFTDGSGNVLTTGAKLWICTTRDSEAAEPLTARLFSTTDGRPIGIQKDFGANCRNAAPFTLWMILVGEPDEFGHTLKRYDAVSGPRALVQQAIPMESVSAFYSIGPIVRDLVAGKGNGKSFQVQLFTDYQNPELTADPTEGDGEASQVVGLQGGSFYSLTYRNRAAPSDNFFLISGRTDGETLQSLDALGGNDLHAHIRIGTPELRFHHRLIVGGAGDGTNTIACFDVPENGDPFIPVWQFNTNSTVRDFSRYDGTTLLAVGDRNADGKSMWLLDPDTGDLIDDYDHGDDLKAVTLIHSFNQFTGFTDLGNVVAGNRAPF